MVFFFYLYALLELLGIFLDTAIIPFSSPVYPVSVSPLRKGREGPASSTGLELDDMLMPRTLHSCQLISGSQQCIPASCAPLHGHSCSMALLASSLLRTVRLSACG
jgi:hypothetical protein